MTCLRMPSLTISCRPILVPSAISACLILGAAFTDGGSISAQSGKKGESWQETNVGSVPTHFGDLVTIAGLPGSYTMVFRNSDGDLRLVELSGKQVPKIATVIHRKEQEPKEKSREKESWKETRVGIIPESFGELTSFTGTRGNYTMIFLNGDGEIRIIGYQGTQLKQAASVIERKDGASALQRVKKEGWDQTPIGSIPPAFGALVTVSGTTSQRSLIFQSDDGEIQIVELKGSLLGKISTKVSREYQ